MKQIILKSIKLTYFKGIKSLEINFNPELTDISGRNESGKSTIYDAFYWVLFGKDAEGSTPETADKFSLKTLDENNVPLPNVEHSVECVLLEDGRIVRLKKEFKEKWQTTRGETVPEFKGHETDCYFDGVKMQIGEYQKRVSSILEESTFKLITDTKYFKSLHWEQQREILVSLTNVKDEDIISANKDLSCLYERLEGRSIEDSKKVIKTTIALNKKSQAEKEAQIKHEVTNVRPQPENFEIIEESIKQNEVLIKAVDDAILNSNEAQKQAFELIGTKQAKINELKTKQQEAIQKATEAENERVFKANEKRTEIINLGTTLKAELLTIQNAIETTKAEKTRLQNLIDSCENNRKQLRELFTNENSKTFNPSVSVLFCPLYKHTCNDSFAIEQFEAGNSEAQEHFNTEKLNKINQIQVEGKGYKEQQEKAEKQLSDIKTSINENTVKQTEIETKITSLRSELEAYPQQEPAIVIKENLKEWVELAYQIAPIEKEIKEVKTADNTELLIKKAELVNELFELRSKLEIRTKIQESIKREETLNQELRDIAQVIANLNNTEFLIDKFTKAKMTEVEKQVNSKFKYVKFKLFRTQVDGQEVEACQMLVNGVPFASRNNASKINIGIDICNAVSEHYGVVAPIWCDNSEAVNHLLTTKGQLITLTVTKEDLIIK